MERFVIDETSNTLVNCNHHMPPERLNYLVIPHQYNGKHIDRIGPHRFDGLVIHFLCIRGLFEISVRQGMRKCPYFQCETAKRVKDWRKMLRRQRAYGDSPPKGSSYHKERNF